MKNNLLLSICLMVTLVWVAACKLNDETGSVGLQPKLPAQSYDYSLQIPVNFQNNHTNGVNFFVDPNTGDTIFILIDPVFAFGFGFNPQNPQITNPGATLGRVLFYDPQLSLNNSISCASCHKQELAFSDGVASSQGFAGKKTPRNSMAILNAGFNNNLFWDSRESSVKGLVTRPIQNHIEMGIEDMRRLEIKLANVDFYPDLFQAAFGSRAITEERIADALAQFVSAITTTNSKFDQESKNNFAGFTTLEMMGSDLFFTPRTNCSRCHAAPNFAAPDFVGGEYGSTGGSFGGNGEDLKGGANNGLEVRYSDPGIGNDKFRIPSLRNIALTAPYMHDGRFRTLEDVVEHYSNGMQANQNLDHNLRNADGSPLRPNLNALEKKAMVAFLHTLTDETLLTDPKYSDPFK